MAKDDPINQTSSRYNQIGAAASMDEIFSRVKQSTEVNTVASQRLRLEGREVKSKLRSLRDTASVLSEGMKLSPNDPVLQEGWKQNRDEYAESLERRQMISQRFDQEKTIAQTKGQNLLTSQINQYTGTRAQTSRINETFGSTAATDVAARGLGTTSYTDFEKQAQQAARSARETAVNLREAAISGAPESKLRELGGKLSESEQQIGISRRGMQMQRQLGQDPQSQFMSINTTAQRGEARLEANNLRAKAEAGELPNLKQLNEQILEAAKALTTLKEEFDDGKMSLEDFNKKAGSAATELNKLEQQEKAVAAAGGGGSGWKTIAAAGGAASAGVNLAQQALINQPIQALNNRAQMAAAQNQQYANLKAALSGDMSALSLIGTGAFQNAADFASGKKTTQQVVQGLGATATGVDAIARGAIELGEGASLGKLGGGTVSSTAKAAIIGAEGAFNVGTQVSDMAQGVTAGQTNINAYNSALEAQKQIMAVPSQFRQSYFDYGRTVTESTRNAGGRREGMMAQMTGNEFLQDMQKLRIDPNQAAKMAGQGIAEQGSAFNMNQIAAARNLERSGYGDMGQNMQRFGRLAGAGAADPTAAMGKIMEDAVSRGMDSSKAVSMMVDATSSLAESSQAGRLGVDATGGVSALIGRTIGDRGNRTDVQAITAAQGAIAGTSQNLTDSSVTFTNMMRDTRLRQMGMSGKEAAVAKTLTTQDMSVLQQGGPEAERLAMQKGLTSMFDKNGKLDAGAVNKYATIQGQYLEQGGASGVGLLNDPATAAKASEFRKRLAAGESASKLMAEDKKAYGVVAQDAALSGQGGAAEVSNIIGKFEGVAEKTKKKGEGDKIMNGTADVGTTAAAGEQIVTAGAVQQNKEIQAGRKDMESLDKVAKVLGSIEKAVTPETMEKFATAASTAAGNMEISATNFKQLSESAGNLDGEFKKLKTTLEGLNTSAANLGGFKTGGGNKGLSADDIKAEITRSKSRADGKPQ